jgi:hypothetical protein
MKIKLKKSKTKELIPGGLANGLSPSAFDKKALEKGIKIELEHTNNRKIAMDHLQEDPLYYEKLSKIENKDLTILSENKHSIIKLQYPEILADLLVDRFGKNAFTVAKWNKEYNSFNVEQGKKYNTKWWVMAYQGGFFGKEIYIPELIRLYEAFLRGKEDFNKVAKKYDFSDYDELTETLTDAEIKEYFIDRVKEKFYREVFFSRRIIKDIDNNVLKDLNPYKNLSFSDASDKYEENITFKQTKPFRQYRNGYRWINVGPKCDLLGKQMKNCGSAGVMSTDPDKTIFSLYDENNTPHVIATHSPNEKRLSGIEGAASSVVKDIYHKYIIDLTEKLGAFIDPRVSSLSLLIRYSLRKIPNVEIENLQTEKYRSPVYKITINSDDYISDGYSFITKDIFDQAVDRLKIKDDIRIDYKFDQVNSNLEKTNQTQNIKSVDTISQIYSPKEVNEMKMKIKKNLLTEDMDTLQLASAPPVDFTGEPDYEGGMAKNQMYEVYQYSKQLLDMIDDDMQLPAWVQSKLTKVADYIGAVKHFIEGEMALKEADKNLSPKQKEIASQAPPEDKITGADFAALRKKKDLTEESWIVEGSCEDDGKVYEMELFYEECSCGMLKEQQLEEAEYQGRKVKLNKPMRGDVKKFKVFVKDPQTGNVKKVNFGDPNMRIKKNIPARRKSFRARHNCDNPGPKTKARYWSCKAW